ncbi:unnamed protein product [Rangifer tarandus platyrhynchus]|uniref:Uncharacterized protein n=1 Tax=Rangifer tarandus platyrhynchus TaxID=3082113 RepID=A0ABN8ZQZ2_RANTA|nr:unnamed protein product [Rangifer tarandus platyrhynchus]
MSIESVMPSNHLILCHPLLLLPSIFPSIRVFSNESALHIRWPKYWSSSFSISPSNEHPGLISFRIDRLDLLAVQGILKSLLQHHNSKASRSAFFLVQLSHLYMTSGKTIALTRQTFVGKVSLCWQSNMLSRLVTTFLPRSTTHTLVRSLVPLSGQEPGPADLSQPADLCLSTLTTSLRWVMWVLPRELTPPLAQSLPFLPWPHLHPSCLPAGRDSWCLHPRSASSLGAVPRPQRVSLECSPPVLFPLSMQTSCVSSHLGQKAATLSPPVSLLFYSQTPLKNWQDLASPFPLPGVF